MPMLPKWKPSKAVDVNTIAERMNFYASGNLNIAVFEHGTCIFLKSPENYNLRCSEVFDAMLNVYPDFNVQPMKDGHYIVTFRDPLYALVLKDSFLNQRDEILSRAEDMKLAGEHVIGQYDNNEHYLIGLYARSLMFADAEERNLVKWIKSNQ